MATRSVNRLSARYRENRTAITRNRVLNSPKRFPRALLAVTIRVC